MDFKNAKELLALCQEKKLPISEVMRQREILLGETTAEIVDQRMDRVLEIMKDAAFSPIKDPVISMGGLIGGEARKLCEFHDLGKSLCGNVLGKGITYAMATLETNASMGLIVASPTAGSAGIVPGMMLALQEVYGFSDKKIRQALFNAGAIGYLAMRNATVAGAGRAPGTKTAPGRGRPASGRRPGLAPSAGRPADGKPTRPRPVHRAGAPTG